MTGENPPAENDRPEEAEEPKEPVPPADSGEEGAEASGEAEAASGEEAETADGKEAEAGDAEAEAPDATEAPDAAEAPEDPLESLQGVKAVRAFLGDAVEEVSSFTGGADEVSIAVPAARLVELCGYLKSQHGFNYLSDLCGVHYPERDRPFEVVYQLFALDRSERLRLRVRLADGEAAPSVTGVWRTANWLEREAYDMFGLRFEGHPDLRRILMPEDYEQFPLRKEIPLKG
ncbi:MAG: NADH-quinone oxidoreductase subunit C [Nitrospinota bacterium]